MSKTRGGLFLLITLGLWSIAFAKRIPAPKFAGPYRISVRSVGNQTDEYQSSGKLWAAGHFTSPNKDTQQQYVWGHFYGGSPFSDDLRIEIRVAQWSNPNHEWKRNAFVFKFDKACSAALTHGKSLIDLIYEPGERKCPLPKVGLRAVKNQTFECTFPHFPILPYNRYLFTLALMNRNEVVGTMVADGNISPK